MLLFELLERALAVFCRLALLFEPLGQKVARLLRREELELQVLRHIGSSQGVCRGSGKRGIRGHVADLDDPGISNRDDVQPAQELVDPRRLFGVFTRLFRRLDRQRCRRGRRFGASEGALRERHGSVDDAPDETGDADATGRRRTVAEARGVPELHPVDRPLCQAAALQDPILRLIELVVEPPVLGLKHLIQRRDGGGILFNQQLCPPLIHRGLAQRVQGHRHEHDDERRDCDPAPFVENAQVVPHVFFFGNRAAAYHGAGARAV